MYNNPAEATPPPASPAEPMDFDLSLSTDAPAPDVAASPLAPPPVPLDRPVSIRAEGLVKQFGKNAPAVQGINLEVREGEFFGFLGPNGAGKSTTIKMLCGMLRPTAGSIRVAGYDMTQQPLDVKRVIGVLPEETSLYERLTGAEYLLFAGQMYGLDRAEAAHRADDLLNILELTGDKKKLIVDYSMGMKKKVALAASLIHRPRVLFLDEPFNGIDPVSVRAIRDVLHQLTARGTTIFFSSHVMEVVERLCSRIAIINRGQIVGEGTIADLRERAHGGGSLEEIFLTLVQARPEGQGETLSWL